MATELRTRFLSAFVFIVLIASAAFTVPARADGGSPPAPPAPSGAVSTGSNTSQNVTQVSSTVTNIAVENNTGHKVNLSSQKAAYVSQTGDPVWCPSSMAAPTPGAGACTANEPDMATLVTYLTGHQKTVDGTIWIDEGGSDASGPNILEGSAPFATMAAHQLTFKGGWTGIGGAINTLNPSVFTNNLYIDNWNNNINVSNITIQGSPEDGLVVYTTKNISLTGVTAYHNNSYGVYLDNTAGTGSITISKSTINQNDQGSSSWGLVVLSHGAISLTNVTVDQSHLVGGAYLDNSSASNKPVTVKSSNFDNNQGNGLLVTSKGAITLANVIAGNNSSAGGAYGVKLDNSSSTTAAPVTLSGLDNTFYSNHDDGLDVYSKGVVKINDGIMAEGNANGYGVYIKNDYPGASGSVTLAGISTIDGNYLDGLHILSNGAITLNLVTSVANVNGYGAFLVNSGALTPQPVTLTGFNTFLDNNFSNNKYDGLNISSKGAIKLNFINASGNTHGNGVYVNNVSALTPQPISFTGTNVFSGNYYDGLDVFSKGAIIASDLTVSGDGTSSAASLNGAELENDFSGAAGGITLTGTNFFTTNYGIGLVTKSKGAITLNNIVADQNNNGVGLKIDNSLASTAQSVNLTGTSEFKFNVGNGLDINSKGVVSLKNITADDNLGNGVVVNNIIGGTGAPKAVTLAGYGVFNNNLVNGFSVQTYGAVTTNNLMANDNGIGSGDDGVSLVNNGAVIPANVTLNGINVFDHNYDYGLSIESKGAIKANSITANSNTHLDGASLDNSNAGSVGAVTLTGTNVFNGNKVDGLIIHSRGTISISNITADNSGIGDGLLLDNSYGGPGAPKPVTISGKNVFNDNGNDGLYLYSDGAISLSNITAIGNGTFSSADGAYIVNSGALVPANITLTGQNNFNNNTNYGLFVNSQGMVSMTRVTADDNASDGLFVAATGKVTLTCGSFVMNISTGLYFTSSSTMTLIGVNTFGNGTNIITTGGGTANYIRSCPLP